jgi:3-phenylpropionate/trans-cinnamate dioxygenase ferredoxin reductase subunit
MRHLDIVVGTDGSEQGMAAVRWAAGEARLRAAPLKIISAYSWSGPPDAFGGVGEPAIVISQQFREMAATAAGRVMAGMNVNVWDVTPQIETLIRSNKPVDLARLADPGIALVDVTPVDAQPFTAVRSSSS